MAATKVLVVDDDLNIQRVLVFTLKQEGYEVHVASDGQAGVEMAASIVPDLILMDVAMPFAGRIRRHPADPRHGERGAHPDHHADRRGGR